MITARGILYGTTPNGGGPSQRHDHLPPLCSGQGCGTVFEIDRSAGERVLHRFQSQIDGALPGGQLLFFKGEIFGTTRAGGTHDRGTVFVINAAGKERVIHSFSGIDGDTPASGLVRFAGAFYGTTYDGGSTSCGSVYRITSSGEQKVVYSFKCTPDGAFPSGELLSLNGRLYGTTYSGGTVDSRFCLSGEGCGTVFSLSSTGNERVIYRFKGQKDGDNPEAGLVAINGLMYGTTYFGGLNPYSEGAVFQVTQHGKRRILHSFGSYAGDGTSPRAGLVVLGDTLYGTTFSGGEYDNGTVFEISP
jgi:uncharacterized repeat protein (TIGR03803 family)